MRSLEELGFLYAIDCFDLYRARGATGGVASGSAYLHPMTIVHTDRKNPLCFKYLRHIRFHEQPIRLCSNPQ
jgi:hypothetical protein